MPTLVFNIYYNTFLLLRKQIVSRIFPISLLRYLPSPTHKLGIIESYRYGIKTVVLFINRTSLSLRSNLFITLL